VVNLAPRRIGGEVSEGRLCDGGDPNGIVLVPAVPEGPAPDGMRLG
jgi:tRNA-binding protein